MEIGIRMAAVAKTDTVTITVNDIELQVPKGELIVESVKRLGLEVPIFCYHARMKPVGMCRMCFVEVGFKGQDGTVKKMPKPQAACSLPATDGMAIYTDTESIHRDRKGVLELLLINHPLDCPICDRGGECPLQNNTLFYGPSTSRFVEIKRHLPKAFPLSKYVTLDLERCIQCGRCVRFTEEISGDAELAFRFRGAEMTPSTFELRDFESKFSGNVIEICPVGALTSAEYRFRARPWDLETKPGICTECSNGCNIWFDHRVSKMSRINARTNEAVNEEWTCDRGKFGHEWYNAETRLTKVLVRDGDRLATADWAEAYTRILAAVDRAGLGIAALAGSKVSNEGLYLLQKLFRESFGSNNLDHRFTRDLPRAEQRVGAVLGTREIQSTIASLEDSPSILCFGSSLADELPILFLRVRKAWFKNGAKVIVAHHEPTDADSFAHVLLRYRPGTEASLASGLLAAAVESGQARVPEATRTALSAFGPEQVERTTGVPAARIREAASILAAGSAIISSSSLSNRADAQDCLESLAGLAMATGGNFNRFALEANEQGALELGVVPDLLPGGKPIQATTRGLDTRQILDGCIDGTVKALWLVGCDPMLQYPDRALAERALESVEFLIVQGCIETPCLSFASVVLPMSAPAEQEGTYVNCERRVQLFRQVIPPKGDSKAAWRVFSEVGLRHHPTVPRFSSEEVLAEIAVQVSSFEGIAYDELNGEGRLLKA